MSPRAQLVLCLYVFCLLVDVVRLSVSVQVTVHQTRLRNDLDML